MLDTGLGRQKRAIQVNGEKLFPVGVGELLNRVNDLDSGIGHENVDPAEGLDTLLDAGIDLIFLGHIHGDADSRLGVAELFCRFCRAIRVQISNDDAPAGLDVTLGNAVTDAARGTSDEGNFTVEIYGPHRSRFEMSYTSTMRVLSRSRLRIALWGIS